MSDKKTPTRVKVEREEKALKETLEALPTNPILWGNLLRIVAPLIARLAVRYALKRVKRGMSEAKVEDVTEAVAGLVRRVIETKKSPD